MAALLDEARFLEGHESAVLVDGLQRAAAQLDAHELVELGHPDALGLKVRGNGALGHLGDVTTDTAFFLGETGTMNTSTTADMRTSDTTNA